MTGKFSTFLRVPVVMAMTVLLHPVAMAATETGTPQVQQLDEIVVKANHLWQIRKAMVETEDRFYARFNELNTNDDFDVDCVNNATPTGSRIQRRRCEIHFYAQAQQQEVSAALGGYYAPEARLVYLERIMDYRDNALKVVNSDLQLRKLVRKREDLGKLYARRQKEIFKDRWIDW